MTQDGDELSPPEIARGAKDDPTIWSWAGEVMGRRPDP